MIILDSNPNRKSISANCVEDNSDEVEYLGAENLALNLNLVY